MDASARRTSNDIVPLPAGSGLSSAPPSDLPSDAPGLPGSRGEMFVRERLTLSKCRRVQVQDGAQWPSDEQIYGWHGRAAGWETLAGPQIFCLG